MDSSEYYEQDGRYYVNPTLSSGEQEKFISNLRDIQSQNNAQIAEQTYNLGTQIPSNLGGLGGGEAYFNARYQTPQVDEMVATLKSAADAQALNDVMSNYQAQLKNKYNQAQRRANKRARARQNAYYNSLLSGVPSGGNGGLDIVTDTGSNQTNIPVNVNPNTGQNSLVQTGKNTYSYQGKTLIPAPTSFMGIYDQGLGLGVWPNGKKVTEGSTYTIGGKTYTYIKADNTSTPNFYQIK